MGTAAEIDEIAAFVHRNDAVVGDVGETFEFVFLIREHFFRFIAGDFDAFERIIRLDDFSHFRFDRGEFFDFEVFGEVEIVIESVLGARSDVEFRFGVELFDRRCHHVRCAVADRFNRKLHKYVLSSKIFYHPLIYTRIGEHASGFEKIPVFL